MSKKKNKQLNLKLRYSPLTWFYTLRERFKKNILYLEMNKYSNEVTPWMHISYAISIVIVIFFFIFNHEQFPSKTALLPIYTNLESRIIESYFIYAIPIVFALLNIIIVRVSYLLYDKDRMFSLVLLSILTLVNTFFLINLIILFT